MDPDTVPDPKPDLLVRGTDPEIRIRTTDPEGLSLVRETGVIIFYLAELANGGIVSRAKDDI